MMHVFRFFGEPWIWDGERFVQDHQQRGLYTIVHGVRKLWYKDIEKIMKQKVYISEYGLDWWSDPYSYRDQKDVVTGVRFSITPEMHQALKLYSAPTVRDPQ